MNHQSQFGRRVSENVSRHFQRAAAPIDSSETIFHERTVLPWASLALAAVVVCGYIYQRRFYLDEGFNWIGFSNAVALGGINRFLVQNHGDWWRIFTSFLLSERASHMIGNALSFLLCGYFIERRDGWQWVFGAFFLGGVAGAVASLVLYPDVYSDAAGQAGCALGMLIALAAATNHPRGKLKLIVAAIAAALVFVISDVLDTNLLTLLNLAPYVGGAGVGFLLGNLFRAVPSSRQKAGMAMAAVSFIIAALSGIGIFEVRSQFPHYKTLSSELIPYRSFPPDAFRNTEYSTDSKGTQVLVDLAARYPRDPMPHLYLGMLHYVLGNYSIAITELQSAAASDDLLQTEFPFAVYELTHRYLAMAYMKSGRTKEASAAARPICKRIGNASGAFGNMKLCP